MQKPTPDPDTIFAELLKDLPADIERLARAFKAFTRPRKINSGAELLRLVLLFAGLDLSEREIAANVILVRPEIESLSNEAVRRRLAACLPWLQALLPGLIKRTPLPDLPAGLQLRVLDASDITAPGQTKVTWRIHLMADLVSLQMVSLHLTDIKTGETLLNFDFQAGEVVLADRGYSHRKGLAHLIESGAQPVVRYNAHHIPVTDRQGAPLDVAVALSACERGETRTLAVQFTAPDGRTYPAYIHAYRLPEEAAAAARRRCRKGGKKGRYTPKQKTLWWAEFVLVLTTVPVAVLSAEVILALYRCRWQVELIFKQFKSLLHLDEVRARAGSPLGQVWLHGKLIYACLIERRAVTRCGAEWSDLDGERRGTWWRVWKLIKQELTPLLTLSQCWDLRAWPAALTALAERQRRRRLQRLPLEVAIWLDRLVVPISQTLDGAV
jgi:Transposase DDE domain